MLLANKKIFFVCAIGLIITLSTACQSNPVAVDPLVNQNQDLMDEIAQIEAEKNALSNRVEQLEQTLESIKATNPKCEL